MTLEQAITELKFIRSVQLENNRVLEDDHCTADEILLKLINDPLVTAAFDAIEKWYA